MKKIFIHPNLLTRILLCSVFLIQFQFVCNSQNPEQKSYNNIRKNFLDLPLVEKTTGPLYWIQEEGNTAKVDKEYVDIMLEGGNGHCTIESRIYKEWLKPSWFEIVDTILNEMKRKGSKAYIFDEAWFPSFDVAGKVPSEYRAKLLDCTSVDMTGPGVYTASGHDGQFYIRTVAGKMVGDQIDADKLVDLTSFITNGTVNWTVPEGPWKIMKFSWKYNTNWGNTRLLDLASQDAADWFVKTVIEPHYENTSAPDAIAGFFYDEPEFYGQWGKGMEEDTPFWKEMLVHRFHTLTGEAQKKAQYIYMETLAERIGRVGYGTYSNYVNSRGGKLIGHFWEHNAPLKWGGGPIDIMEVQKYSDMGGIDYVIPGRAAPAIRSKSNGMLYQMGRLGASIAITNNMDKNLAMNECFAGYKLENYATIKWSSDLSTIQGSQYLIPHSFNPGNYDQDWQPWFYRSGTEISWPLYKIWSERQNRLAYMLSGNDSVNYRISPVAVIWGGLSSHVGKYTMPFNLLTAFESSNYDPILMTDNRFESTATIDPANQSVNLYHSSYKILALPSAEYIPNATLVKARKFYDAGGIIIAWGTVPSKSAKFDATDADVQSNISYLFGSPNPSSGTKPIKTNNAGGKTFYINETENIDLLTSQINAVAANSSVNSTFKVLTGLPSNEEWILYQHRKRDGIDLFMVWNGNDTERVFTARLTATGSPEIWNPTNMKITMPVYERVSENQVDVKFHLNREEAVMVVFNPAGSGTSVCKTDVDEIIDVRGTGKHAKVEVVVSVNKDYVIYIKDGSQYYKKNISVRGLPAPIPVIDGSVNISSEYLNSNYVISVNVGSAESVRVNVNQDYVPHQGNSGLAGGVIISPELVDITSKAISGSNRIQIQPKDIGDTKVLIFKKIKVSGFKKCSRP